MYQIENVLAWVISVFFIICLFYGMMLFLPLLLLIVGGYILYQFVKVWLWRRAFRKSIHWYDIQEDSESANKDKIIDAEFEILDEK